MSQLTIGDQAPDFSLPDSEGRMISLASFRGTHTVVLYFYPKDETPGCTAEACGFRDAYDEFARAGAQVIGVSGDSSESHHRFAAHHNLPFILLSDTSGAIKTRYGVRGTLGLLPGRVTFVIDKQGIIRYMSSTEGIVRF